MRRAVILWGRQEPRVVGEIQTLHQRRDKLLCGKTAEREIFRRDDDVRTSRRRSDQLLFCETAQGEPGGGGGNAQRRLHLAPGKFIAPPRRKTPDAFPCTCIVLF